MSLRRRSYDLSGVTLSVESDLVDVTDRLDVVFGCFRVESLRVPVNVYRILSRGSSVDVSIGEGPFTSYSSAEHALDYVQWHMSQSALSTPRSEAVALHAAAVARTDGAAPRAVLLFGASGSGKSTLTLALMRRGYVFLSDEAVFLDPSGCSVQGFPRAIGVLSQSADRRNENPKEYLDPSTFGVPIIRNPVSIECLFLLSDRGDRSHLKTISPLSALPVLLKQVYAAAPVTNILAALIHLVTSHPILELTAGDPAEAAELVADYQSAYLAA